MALTPGTRLGQYEILSAIGAGGMGEVYRAKDSKLGRDVAIKVLHEAVAQDAERLARFEREARTLATLNHPNIVTIFAVEESDGTRFLTMELVEGETLDTVITAGGLPLFRFFEITVPLAEALSAAHERGIVHRDLKPGNVMVTREGRVKVLDFGLAKLEDPHSDPNLTNSPTQTRADLTGEGQVFGTVAYMSPEQARGGKVDARSDVFSLGVVLYQLLTGERPFQGGSAVDMISSILRDKPPSVTDMRADLPPHLGKILRRCLEKDPRDRYQTSRDVYNELKELRAETSTASTDASASSPRSEAGVGARPPSGSIRADEGFWVAVLPFKHQGAGPELGALAEGITEEILTGLSRFSYLRVIARGSTARHSSEPGDLRAAGKELGARYVIEGSLRQAGARLRVAAQLVDTTTGAHLWAETYERAFDPEAIFELQDELVPRIVSTIADQHGILVRSITAVIRNKADAQLSAYEAVFRVFGLHERMTPQEHAAVRDLLERVVRDAPDQSDSWAMLATVYSDEHMFGFHGRPDPLGRALVAARRAIEGAPASPLASQAMAQSLFFRREKQAFRPVAERTIALNPMDGATTAFMGILLACAGDWEHGCAVADKAMRLNPHFPGWYWLAAVFNAYRTGDYRASIDAALRIQMPGYFWTSATCAAAFGQLGERQAAQASLEELLAIRPEFARAAREEFAKWFEPELVEHLIDGLQKAGLEIATEGKAAAPAVERAHSSADVSGSIRAAESFWVAVLPFKYTGGNADVTALAEGLSEEIVAGLSRFSYLRVITSGSTQRYAAEAPDLRVVGKDLGARYVMNGNLRQVGARLRVAVQLVDTTTGAHLWADNYERTFSPESVFELQDELVPRIVSTVADSHGVLLHSMSEALRSKSADQLSPYEAVLRSFGYFDRVNAEELAAARSALELAVRKAPGYADAWAMLALLCAQEYGQGYSLLADSLADGSIAARRAVEAGPSNHLAHSSLAQVLFLQKEFQAFRNAAARAAALNPMDGATVALMGILLAYAGDWERGCAMAEGAMRLNPHFPGWYRLATIVNAYRTGDYRAAIDAALRIQMPGYFWTPVFCAAAFGQLDERESARKALGELLAIRPGFGSAVREDLGKWHEPELVEHFIDGLRKAGLDVPALVPAGLEATSAREPGAVAIAVLPFSDMSPARDQEYFCEGMAEEIMNALVRIDGIRVASRTSAFRARQDASDLAAIARALSVGHVLEGSVRTSGTRLRVTAQLTDVASGYQLWSERFDREAADVFAIQDEIAAGVVDAVKARLAPGVRTVQARARTHNLEAYRSYLKGRHLRGKEHHAEALQAFEEAVRLDPSHAPSWTGLAEITVLSAHMGAIPPRAACAAARKALATAQELQGESAEGLHVEAFAAFIERRWDAMETTWRRAIELQPDHVLALGSFGISLCARHKLDEALPLFERAREADPLASFPYTLAGWGLLMSGRPQDALRQVEDALTFEKEDATAVAASCIANLALGRFEEGIAAGEHGVALTHRAPFFLGVLAWALATAGRSGAARTILEELRARPAASPTVVSEAWLLGALGEIDDAFEVLARAEDEYQGLLCYTGLPGFDPLRSDPRFAALEQRLELPSALRGGTMAEL